MKRIAKGIRGLICTLLMGMPAVSTAEDTNGAIKVVVEQPWARASLGTSRPGGAYLTLRNAGEKPVTLIGIRADIAGMTSIHETQTDNNGVSSMMPAADIEIPAGETLSLKPGSYHIMLMKLQAPLVEGETFPIILLFADGTELEVMMPVLRIGARGPED